ncbi:MAG TPA: hypothetical protein DCL61_08695 [Cyanobacteria bacterium UBA12227]|nr:hypothetical protein [Cyanobacteria bacterium UBA12227]HAX88180.1 hypothetical protein [Cyanobacteria bacterium UBA11370]HBY80648.1 hypothetical protein [Cyanobacteria bacterium UBA11148]
MQLNELKQQVYELWKCVCKFNGAIVQPENFKPEVRTYGDLRRRSTWEKAYAVFFAKLNWDSDISGHTAICYVFNFSPNQWNYKIRYEIIEQFLAIPGAMEFIIRGLEDIFNSADKEDIEYAKQFLEVVGKQQGRTGECTTRHLWRLIESSTSSTS